MKLSGMSPNTCQLSIRAIHTVRQNAQGEAASEQRVSPEACHAHKREWKE